MAEAAHLDLAVLALRTVESIPAMVAYWDADQRCVFANSAYRTLFMGGAKVVEDPRGMSMADALGPTYAEDLRFVRRVLAGETQVFERRIVQADGRVIQSRATYVPDIIGGRVTGFTAHEADLTEARDREAALARSSELLERTGALAKVGGAELDLRSGEVWWATEM